MVKRCGWVSADKLYQDYHDTEWGVPIHDDRLLFEYLLLEGAHAGLSWLTVLKKRESYRQAFDHFDPEKIARYDEANVAELLANPGIIRNKLKVRSAIGNAQAYLRVVEEYGSFREYIWSFVGGSPRVNHWNSLSEVPASTAESDAMSKALRKRGFTFVGTTICYAFMQATGMVMDHTTDCFRYTELTGHNHAGGA